MLLRNLICSTIMMIASLQLSVSALRHLGPYANAPMVFEPNRRQARPDAAFVARSRGYTVEIFARGARAVLSGDDGSNPAVLEMEIVQASPGARAVAEEPQPGRSHYFIGSDAARHLRDIPHFAKVSVRGVYPAIDLVYYGKQSRLEYDFVVAPGADPRSIALRFRGHESMQVTADGGLVFRWRERELHQPKPVLYQLPGRRPVDGRFVLARTAPSGSE